MIESPHDLEKGDPKEKPNKSSSRVSTISREAAVVGENELTNSTTGILGLLQRAEEKIGGGSDTFEAMGAGKIPSDQRVPSNILDMVTFWFSMNFSPAFLIVGIYGPALGLSVNEAITISLTVTLLASIGPAFTATLCPGTGLRQIAVSRFTFGIVGSKIAAAANLVINLGYAILNALIGGQIITTISEGEAPIVVGILVISVFSFVVILFGIKWILVFEKYVWVLTMICMFVILGEARPYFTDVPNIRYSEGITHTGAALTFTSLIFGSSIGWAIMSGDYYVYYEPDISKMTVFWSTYFGLIIPVFINYLIGCELGGIYMTNSAFAAEYDKGSIAGAIAFLVKPEGWAKTLNFVFIVSYIANQVTTLYSATISLQTIDMSLLAIPRFVWTIILSIIAFMLAWAGHKVMLPILINFTTMLGYWATGFVTCMALEHFLFRRGKDSYNSEDWLDQGKMPWGIAGTFCLLGGYGLAFLGMNQTWFVGPFATRFGDEGGDVALYFVLVLCVVLYPPLRYVERRHFGR